MSIKELGALIGKSINATRNIELGETKLTDDIAERLAKALETTEDAVRGKKTPQIAIKGRITGGSVQKTDRGETPQSPYEMLIPEEDRSDSALEVTDNSIFPIAQQGSLLIYRAYDYVHPQTINNIGIIELTDGRHLIRQVLESKMPGYYIIQSVDRLTIEEAILKSASPINEIRRKWKGRE